MLSMCVARVQSPVLGVGGGVGGEKEAFCCRQNSVGKLVSYIHKV